MGFVVFVPLGWALVLKARPGSGGAYTLEIIKSRPDQRKAELVQPETLPRVAYKLVATQK
jgi:hypothetical protein